MNKKGKGESVGIFILFLLMGIVIAGIVGGVFAFFGDGVDYREIEAENLAFVVEKCFLENEFGEDFNLDVCGLSKISLEEKRVIFIEDGEGKEVFSFGEKGLRTECFLDAAEDNENIPVCVRKEVLKNGESFEIVVGSLNNPRRVVR